MEGCKILTFAKLGDERGQMVVGECEKEIPFDIKRIFYMYNTQGSSVRGQHANRKSEFVLINLKGSCKILVDNGFEKETFILDEAHKGIYLDKMVWKEMYDFSEDAILLVLSNEHYDGNEYIRDYEDYLKERRIKNDE